MQEEVKSGVVGKHTSDSSSKLTYNGAHIAVVERLYRDNGTENGNYHSTARLCGFRV